MKLIALTKGQETKVDDSLYGTLNSVKWCVNYRKTARKYYVKRQVRWKGKRITEYLHWYVVGKPMKGCAVDHINGDPLDNQRSNLRVVSIRQNNQNKLSHRNGRLFGASYYKKYGKWGSQIGHKGKSKYLGYFSTQEEAHSAYMNELSKEKLLP